LDKSDHVATTGKNTFDKVRVMDAAAEDVMAVTAVVIDPTTYVYLEVYAPDVNVTT
jgi:hypothetical protein